MGGRVDRFLRTYMARIPRRGPVMLMGLMWFGVVMVVALLASLSGPAALAVFFGLFGALAALQAGLAWRKARSPINQVLAALIALVLPLAALAGNRVLGVVIVVAALGSLVLGAEMSPAGGLSGEAINGNLAVAGATLRVGFPLGLLGASLVQIERISWLTLALTIAVVCVYDAGYYLIGSTVAKRSAGFLAGIGGGVVVSFAAAAFDPPPFEANAVAHFVTILAAVACALGQFLGSFMLPNAIAKAPALRRLDAWLVVGPLIWLLAAVGS